MATYLRARLLQQLTKHLQRSTWEGVGQCLAKTSEDRMLACALCVPNPSRRLPWTIMGLGFAAASVGSFVSPSEAACSPAVEVELGETLNLAHGGMQVRRLKPQVIFVLGGPGSGKGTQCAKLVEEFGLLHLSAGDLLRAHMHSGSPDGNMVAEMIKQGQIVPSRVTISLLEEAMLKAGKQQVLIDGFPRNEENRAAFELQTGIQPEFVLFFDCPEAVMEARLLARQQGRTDDNIETIRKRFQVFLDSSMPVIDFYEKQGKVRRINADRPSDDIYYGSVKPLVDALRMPA